MLSTPEPGINIAISETTETINDIIALNMTNTASISKFQNDPLRDDFLVVAYQKDLNLLNVTIFFLTWLLIVFTFMASFEPTQFNIMAVCILGYCWPFSIFLKMYYLIMGETSQMVRHLEVKKGTYKKQSLWEIFKTI